MASIAGLYGGFSNANQEDGSGGRSGFMRGWRNTGGNTGDKNQQQTGVNFHDE